MARSLLFLAIICAVVRPATVLAQVTGQTHADSVQFRNLCRQSEQIVRVGAPAARVPQAITQLRYCGVEARGQLIEAWTVTLRGPSFSDSMRVAYTEALIGLVDRSLFENALEAAQSPGLSFEQRTLAMIVVVAQLDPQLWFKLEDLRNIPGSHYCGGPRIASHVDPVIGATLPPDAAARVSEAMRRIIADAGRRTPLGAAAACVLRTSSVIAEHPTP